VALCLPGSALAVPKTHVHLILSAESARPGDTIWAGLEMEMPPGWHTYWRNGGDAGSPTKIDWQLPPGILAGDINWPIPSKLSESIGDSALVTYVYTNTVVLLTPITIAKDAAAGPARLEAVVSWMECSDLCVMGHATVSAMLTISDQTKPSAEAAVIEQWRRKLPMRATLDEAEAAWGSNKIINGSRPVSISWKSYLDPADFYPYADTNFDVSGTTSKRFFAKGGWILLTKIIKTNGDEWPQRISGILVGKAGSSEQVGVEVTLPIKVKYMSFDGDGGESFAVSPSKLLGILAFAFLGGLILNIMPCVLPIIALKVLSFVKQSAESPGRVRNLGIVYGLGVIASFLVLAGLAIGVQHAGGVANWGDAFRNPHFQVALTVLMTLIALNLFGVFEVTLSSKTAGAAKELASRPGYAGALFNGVLATVLATPCTAPFLGAALAFAFTQSAGVTLLVFAVVGVGFAFPFVLLCAQPRWLRLLPKPGAWMEKFKVAMGFPMLATAVWLMWISESGDEVFWLGLELVVLSMAAWVWGEFVQRGRSRKGLAAVIAVLLATSAFGLRVETRPDPGAIHWEAWSPQAVEEARRNGHPVLVDFTAKSCLTCQVNKHTSLEIDRTRAKLKQVGAVAMIGDFTREDPAIAAQLQQFNRGGVPLVLVYSKDTSKPPEVLPVILSPSIVLDALARAAQ
jgi:thiol:disulfide interchange protein DsbD